jgi:heat shock protein HspQ
MLFTSWRQRNLKAEDDMGTVTHIGRAKFAIGDLIYHRMFKYRGVVIDVDSTLQLTDEWYDAVARSRPPKDRPWYHVLVHGAAHVTYVAERNLQRDASLEPIDHPMVTHFFSKLENGRYVRETRSN